MKGNVNTQIPFTNPAIKELMRLLSTAEARTLGSQERKTKMLANLKSMIVAHGSPSIYLTINPNHEHSPLALRFAGEDIDPFDFFRDAYSATERMRIALQNPQAVNEYFDTIVRLLIECLFEGGLFGRLVAYFGVKEYQGRGAPHVHMVLWVLGFGNLAQLRERA